LEIVLVELLKSVQCMKYRGHYGKSVRQAGS